MSLPAIILSLAIVGTLVVSRLGSHRVQQAEKYQELAFAAVAEDDIETADIYLARAIDLAVDRKARSFEIARELYEDGFADRSLELLSSLAPLRHQGYVPAHEFLADHWRSRDQQTLVTQVLEMYHEMHAAGIAEEPRLKLAQFLSDIGQARLQNGNEKANREYQGHALACLRIPDPSPKLRLLQMQIYSRAGRTREARRLARAIEESMRERLALDSGDTDARIFLGRAVASQGRILGSMFELTDGYESDIPPRIVDQLIYFYSIWLSQIPSESQPRQFHELALALNLKLDEDGVATLEYSSGESVELPSSVVALHTQILQGEGGWLIPLLEGSTQRESDELDVDNSIRLLKTAQALRPQNPVVCNNLAWLLLKRHEEQEAGTDAGKQSLAEAGLLIEQALSQHPEEPSFLETRGQIRGALGEWAGAVSDLQACLDMGYDTPSIRATLTRAREDDR